MPIQKIPSSLSDQFNSFFNLSVQELDLSDQLPVHSLLPYYNIKSNIPTHGFLTYINFY